MLYTKQELLEREFFKDFDDKKLNYSMDSLTGLVNRETILEYVQYLMDNNKKFSLVEADLDNFKYVNDNYGHLVGDQVLKAVSSKLVEITRSKALIGRYGGDEFILVFEDLEEYDSAWNIYHKINLAIGDMRLPQIKELSLTITLGSTRYPLDAKTYDELFACADKALYRGKMKGRNCFIIYLDSKHKDIDLKGINDKKLSTRDVHFNIYDILNKQYSIKENIQNVIDYLSSNLMVDHICIETPDGMFFDKIHKISSIQHFEHIDYNELAKSFNSNGLFWVNTIGILKTNNRDLLFNTLNDQQIKSCLYAEIRCGNEIFGLIRFDACGSGRIWQNDMIDFALCAGLCIGMILKYNNIESIKDIV